MPPSKRRKLLFENSTVQEKILHEIPIESTCNSTSIEDNENQKCSNAASQTCERWINPLDFIAVVAENNFLKMEMAKNSIENLDLQRKLKTSEETCNSLSKVKSTAFDIDNIIEDEKLIRYYSGFTKDSFNSLFTFLVPNQENPPLTYVGKGNLTEINSLSLKNQLFLTLSKLRNNFDLQDLGFRFGVTQQVAGVIFNSWVNYMFLRFGEVSIWPHRDVIYENMPENYKRDFPNTFGILDCTEIKIQKPSSLKAQSQTYSDYKSSNTLKGLVAVDPRGSMIFSSMLFTGSVSDKDIFVKSGFKTTLSKLIENGHLERGDGLMADKGFNIEHEVESTGLKLNIPPFAKSGTQMNQQDALFTKKIAKHRVHVERAIRRIKSFKILSGRIPLSMLSTINQIWYICSFLTNFMPFCIRKK